MENLQKKMENYVSGNGLIRGLSYWKRMAGGLGFEPRLAESESAIYTSKFSKLEPKWKTGSSDQ